MSQQVTAGGTSKVNVIFRKELRGIKSSRSFLIVLLASPALIAAVIVSQLFLPFAQVTAAASFELPLLAVIYSLTIAAMISMDSFVGERTTRTIEPLLAAPVSDMDMFVGKVLAAFVPAIGITYTLISGVAGVIYLRFGPMAFEALSIQSLIQLLWQAPVLALLATCIITIASAKVSDARAAMQLANYTILGLVFALGFLPGILPQSSIVWFGPGLDVVLTGVCVVLFWIGVKTFNRESMMSRI